MLSQTVAEHYSTLGSMYLLGNKRSPIWQSERTRDNHPILFQCWAGNQCRPTLCVPGTSIDAYTDLSVMVGIGLHVEDILVCLVLSIIISCTFRILADEKNQYSYVKYKAIFCLKHSNRPKQGLGVCELLFYFYNAI